MRVVDLFGGIGGLGLGWLRAGHEITVAVERDRYCADTYAKNFGSTKVLGHGTTEGDVTRLAAADIATPGEVDVVVGGPPCQAFSVMGRNRPDDPRAHMIHEFTRLAEGLGPRHIVMENVPGILRGFGLGVIAETRSSLEACGYHTAIWQLDSADYATPQKRVRVFLVASKDTLPPKPAARGRVSVAEAIQDLPALLPDSPWPVPPSAYACGLGAHPKPTGHILTKHQPATAERLGRLGFAEEDRPTGMRRLDPDGLAWTLRASSRNRTACRPVHPYEPRAVTPRESARLSGFPDSFLLSTNIAQALADIGNAVPPPLAFAVAEQFIDH